MTDIRELYARSIQQFGEKVRAIRDEQWTDATPCTEWDVRALVNHLVYENLWAPPLFEGKTVAEVGNAFDGDQLGDEPLLAWERSATAAVDAANQGGAMTRTVHLSFADVPGEEYARQLFTDFAIHGWDLARAIGADEGIDPEFVDVLYADNAPKEEELKSYGLYGSKVVPPGDADTQTKLLAIFGRTA
jgi:uncharacterized protein (TIGR03086 family)